MGIMQSTNKDPAKGPRKPERASMDMGRRYYIKIVDSLNIFVISSLCKEGLWKKQKF